MQAPLICHECWPKKTNHYGPCEHAMAVFEQGRQSAIAGEMAPGDFEVALRSAERGYETWASKPHNRRWARKFEGTPAPNDIAVCIAEAFSRKSA